jgi:uncharacterized membrane protein
MKNAFIVLCILLLGYQTQGQTLKIAHKSHSGNMKNFVVSKTTHNLGLPSNYAEKKEQERKKKDSILHVEEKKKQDSIKKVKKVSPKKKVKNLKEESKIEKSSLDYQNLQKTNITTVGLSHPVVYQSSTEGSSKNWAITLMTILPTFLLLFIILQKIKWL